MKYRKIIYSVIITVLFSTTIYMISSNKLNNESETFYSTSLIVSSDEKENPAFETNKSRANGDIILRNIIIPDLILNDADMNTVSKFLSECSRNCDPNRKGVSILATNMPDSVKVSIKVEKPGMSLYDILDKLTNDNDLELFIDGGTIIVKGSVL